MDEKEKDEYRQKVNRATSLIGKHLRDMHAHASEIRFRGVANSAFLHEYPEMHDALQFAIDELQKNVTSVAGPHPADEVPPEQIEEFIRNHCREKGWQLISQCSKVENGMTRAAVEVGGALVLVEFGMKKVDT